MLETNCLLIDDDLDDQEFFAIGLKKVPMPINYSTAKNGLEALDLLSSSSDKPHFIFLDLNMPILSGKECLPQIRQLAGYDKVPIIIFSTSSYKVDIEDCQKLGATHFFTKVHSIKTLTETITQLISGEKLPFVLNATN
ncbi:CheY-like chemotaxis protein [Algoriphagus ratkowskyi]|uniref:CheY-like chemotaxis protein n=1 Tax=Algoriphagus ratkowskyi TaxID=57028 RepID=A0A2W7R4C4_9BACT|nr:response regulator [Algoriphagus ratkowskyi]PZX55344.1 CheY-like chemotaxis protein [Algoriphagus ratkowskyi]TXD79725.1 response regulator [Algoriphagus ratkowskyi]